MLDFCNKNTIVGTEADTIKKLKKYKSSSNIIIRIFVVIKRIRLTFIIVARHSKNICVTLTGSTSPISDVSGVCFTAVNKA